MPDVRVLMLSMHDDEHYLFEALKAGASGYVLKREAGQDLVGAVRAVGRGDAFLTNAKPNGILTNFPGLLNQRFEVVGVLPAYAGAP